MSRSRYVSGNSRNFIATTFILGLLLVPALAGAVPCTVPDDGSGTVSLPPPGCGYLSPQDVHIIINGLPPGTTIRVAAQHQKFFGITHMPGGSFGAGGEIENFNSVLILNMQGTGGLTLIQPTKAIQAQCESHVAPRPIPADVQSFDTDMQRIQGQISPSDGDPDFDLLRITAGTAFGMPSPGHTTLTRLPSGDWNVDSFFDIFYEIEFVGKPGGPLSGRMGSTTGTIRMKNGQPAPAPCVQVDAGGTVILPPNNPPCGYLSPADVHQIINGLPAGTTIMLGAEHHRFFNITTTPGGSLGGNIEQFQSTLRIDMKGTGSLGSMHRVIDLQAQCQTHTAPRNPGASPQSFDAIMNGIQGQIPAGDPDFDLLRITAGNSFGMPSPGHTTLTQLPGGNWNVESFFDITYRIEFIGRPGGALSGRSGSTTGTIRMQNGQPPPPPPANPCVVVDNGTGTVDLPPIGCDYLSPDEVHMIINGLPAGTTINLGAIHQGFFNVTHGQGGTLGGGKENFQSVLAMTVTGTGELQGYHRTLQLQPQCETHTGPRTPGSPIQSFDTNMFALQGLISSSDGDPDFDLLRITAGSAFMLPSPGHTTLTRLTGPAPEGPPSWNVDSFFDITYRIDFVGRSPGPLAGRSGSTTGTIRMQTGQTIVGVPIGDRPAKSFELTNRPNPFGEGTSIMYRLPGVAQVRLSVFDAAGHRVRTLSDDRFSAGPHAMFWDGRNDSGRKLGSGTYFVKLSVNGKVAATRQLTLVR